MIILLHLSNSPLIKQTTVENLLMQATHIVEQIWNATTDGCLLLLNKGGNCIAETIYELIWL